MGLILPDQETAILTAKQPKSTRKTKNEIDYSERGCDACPLQEIWPRISTPKMPLSGAAAGDTYALSRKEDILILGEGPGEEEDIKGVAFVGKAGKLLRRHLPMRQMDRIAIGNVVRCRPPGNRTPTGHEGHCCSIHLENDVNNSNFKAILGLGGAPLSRFVPESNITSMAGVKFPVEVGNKTLWYFPTFHPSFILRMGEERAAQHPVFSADIATFFKEVDNWPKPIVEHPKPEDVICVYKKEDAYALYEKLGKGEIGCDIETLGLRAMERGNLLLTASLSDGDLTFSFPVYHPASSNNWGLELVLRATAEHSWVAHNAAFEFAWLTFWAKKFGLAWNSARFEDSMALGRLYHARESLLDLGIMTHILLGTNIKKLTDINTRNIMAHTLEDVLPYNGLDAYGSVKIWKLLKDKVDKYNYEGILGSIKSTTYMELAGLPINRDTALALEEQWSSKAAQVANESKTLYEIKEYERDFGSEFNIGSNDQVGTALVKYGRIDLPKTIGGHYSTDDEALRSAAENNPLARNVLDYREASKHVSTYIKPILRVDERFADEMLHPSYSTMLVATLRRSSTDPNIQNFPKRRHKELRRPIEAPPGHLLVSFDQGQIDARVYGMASEDKALCDSFINDEDIHSHWLNRVLAIYPDYVQRLAEQSNESEESRIIRAGRTIIKTDLVFASFYGTQAKNCAERTGIPFIVIQEILEEFWGRYPRAAQWLKDRRKEYQNTGGVRTLTNRFYHGVMSGNEMINYPIQSVTGDFVRDAMNDLSQLAMEIDDFYLHPRIEIHDDLTFILPEQEDRLEVYIEEIAKVMTKVRFKWQIVPLVVEVAVGKTWDSLEEITKIKGDYVR